MPVHRAWNRCRRNAPHELRSHDQAENPHILFGSEPGANHDSGIEFAPNSPLEGDGFELPVPRQRRHPQRPRGEAVSHREPVATSERSSLRATSMMAISVSFLRNWERWTDPRTGKGAYRGMVT